MTPIRKKESLQAELIGLEHLLSITPDDPIATPLLKGQIEEKRKEIKKLEEQIEGKVMVMPETEIFFGAGPVIGSNGIEAGFAGQVLKSSGYGYESFFRQVFWRIAKNRQAARRSGINFILNRIAQGFIWASIVTAQHFRFHYCGSINTDNGRSYRSYRSGSKRRPILCGCHLEF